MRRGVPRWLAAFCLAAAAAGCESNDLEGLADGAGALFETPAEPAPEAGGTDPAVSTLPEPYRATGQATPAPQPAAQAPALPTPTTGAAEATPSRAPLEEPPEQAPDIYMALQQNSAGTISIVFAIDEAKDNTPSDDRAIRLTPENGKCNPQEMTSFAFPEVFAARPIFSELEARERVSADKLPNFMAIAVSTEMMRLGYAGRPEDTHPQNVCTRKLWERLVGADLQAQAARQ